MSHLASKETNSFLACNRPASIVRAFAPPSGNLPGVSQSLIDCAVSWRRRHCLPSAPSGMRPPSTLTMSGPRAGRRIQT
jgi:hypothetical protein